MKLLKTIAISALLVGASMGVSTAANAWYGAPCGWVHYGYGWNDCNTCARPCYRPCRRVCNPCRRVCNPCGYGYGYYGY